MTHQRNANRRHSCRRDLIIVGLLTTCCTVANAGEGPQVLSLSLIDADSDTAVAQFDPIANGAVINLAVLPSRNVNIRANTSPGIVGSVVFGLQSDPTYRIENGAPYAMFGDAAGDYLPFSFDVGPNAAEATAHTGANGIGVAGPTHQIEFNVVDYALNIDAGPDLVFASPPPFITLDATVDPPDAIVVSLTWTQLAGPPVSFNGTQHVPANISDLTNGEYTFRIRAVDALGVTADDRVSIRIGTPDYPWEISGELRQWHAVTLTFEGPFVSETDSPNPFTDHRLNVTFTNGDTTLVAPGYFAADGNAAESGATAGNKWRVHFSPPKIGHWFFATSFRQGPNVAADDAPNAGSPIAFDGTTGSFAIAPSDKSGRDHRGKGTLKYVDEHYLRFADSGEYFLKGGADSPENFLAYADFDDTIATHAYAPHIADWTTVDPQWRGDKGHGIIGSLNYLAGKGMNSVYFLTMNVNGDGNDVWPWISPTQRTRYDCSRLDQWNIVFSHMDTMGLALHVVTQETENDQLLDGGDLGIERRIYYRELIARFAHHLAVVWNLGEENSNTDEQRAAFADYFAAHDPYGHPVVVHTFPGAQNTVYEPLLGNMSLDGASLQIANNFVVSEWIERSANAGRPWVVCYDEQAPASAGVVPDADDYWHDSIRKEVLWGTLMGGGAGVEYYFGYDYPHNDLNCEDWRSRDHLWDMTRIALDFFHTHLPFERMRHANDLVSAGGALCFAEVGTHYAIYLPNGQQTNLNLESHPGEFSVRWFNPREGGPLLRGDISRIAGPGQTAIGLPPTGSPGDWLALVEQCDCGCGADINGDGLRSGEDIAIFVACIAGDNSSGLCAAADIDGDGFANAMDAAQLAEMLLCTE
jgi:Domain of unknown function (DUF5060)/K319L-like, PKD domain/Dockerin type I domain/Putative collagen-binding domain of a collagenase